LSQKSFDKWYNYRQAKVGTCAVDGGASEDVDKKQKETPPVGLFVVLEAENVSLALDSNVDVQEAVVKALEWIGFTVMGKSTGTTVNDKFFVCVMKEGYVAARVFAENKYIAFDIALCQTTVSQIDDVMESLMTTVGGDLQKVSTSYRFVTPGIYGLNAVVKQKSASTWCDMTITPKSRPLAEIKSGKFQNLTHACL
jgi:hypothetical protein